LAFDPAILVEHGDWMAYPDQSGRLSIMSYLLESYRRNFEAARLEAERSALPNVRDRAARAAEAWKAMADRPGRWNPRSGPSLSRGRRSSVIRDRFPPDTTSPNNRSRRFVLVSQDLGQISAAEGFFQPRQISSNAFRFRIARDDQQAQRWQLLAQRTCKVNAVHARH